MLYNLTGAEQLEDNVNGRILLQRSEGT